jgi:hypothetical protein
LEGRIPAINEQGPLASAQGGMGEGGGYL